MTPPDHIRLDPKPSKLIHALRAIGYSFPQAIADLVDNSVNAKATEVAVRAVAGPRGIMRILIVDNGRGMTRSELDESMRLGADTHRDVNSLGKYGMGLKLASLSQAQRMTVLTRSHTHCGGRRWTIDGISKGWECEILPDHEVLHDVDNPHDSIDLSKGGTVVIWEELDKIRPSKGGVDATISLLFTHLRQHLGVHFHRFLEDDRLRIYLERCTERDPAAIRAEVVPALNPFSYDRSGHSEYPKTFMLPMGEGKALSLEAHIWPPNSTAANYRLGGKAANRQGLYFYRNDRLIQAGGWNGVRANDAEPHLSLARVCIDLPHTFDELFGLSVQKASVQVPPAFTIALPDATAKDTSRFSDYTKAAQTVYRSGERQNASNHPLVPQNGLRKQLQKELQEILGNGAGRVRKVHFVWAPLHPARVFELERDAPRIRLNSLFRHRLLQGQSATASDAAILKVLLFMLTRDIIVSERFSSQQRQAVEQLNRVLLATVGTLTEEE